MLIWECVNVVELLIWFSLVTINVIQVRPCDKFIMSFQGIRKIRDNRRESPVLLESVQLPSATHGKPFPLHLEIKSTHISNDIRTTRDSEIKADSPLLMNRRTFAVSGSKEKDKRLLIGNFL